MFNQERFHNELAMRLGYELIVKDKRITISVEESDDPLLILKAPELKDIRFKASEQHIEGLELDSWHDYQIALKPIFEAARQAYIAASKTLF